MIESLGVLHLKFSVQKRNQYGILNHLLFLFVIDVQLLNFFLDLLPRHNHKVLPVNFLVIELVFDLCKNLIKQLEGHQIFISYIKSFDWLVW